MRVLPKPIDIVITWPKTRSLESYVNACNHAQYRNQEINYRVARSPSWEFGALKDRNARCYVVHDGAVRGWNEILYTIWREGDEVLDPITNGFWPEGTYLVRDPEWHPVTPRPLRGFQGWRWYDADAATQP